MEMKKYLQMKLKNEKGMTLIELLAVIVIIAIIAAIAIPAISGIIENSRVGAIKSDAQNVLSASELYFTDNTNETDVTVQELFAAKFLDDMGSFESATAGTANPVTVYKKGATVSSAVMDATSISGMGSTGKVSITFTTANRAEIEAVANSSATGTTGVAVVNRNYTP